MKFTAAVVAVTTVAVSSFAPSATFVRSNTALQGHALAGYRPGKDTPEPAPAPAPAGGVPGFSGFGHATGDAPAASTTGVPGFSGFDHATGASTSAPAPQTPPAPVFSGFGHATGPMGGNPSITLKK